MFSTDEHAWGNAALARVTLATTSAAVAVQMKGLGFVFKFDALADGLFEIAHRARSRRLDRTQPGLPMKRGRDGTMTHDYMRNGTTTLFAALITLHDTVISMCEERPRHVSG